MNIKCTNDGYDDDGTMYDTVDDCCTANFADLEECKIVDICNPTSEPTENPTPAPVTSEPTDAPAPKPIPVSVSLSIHFSYITNYSHDGYLVRSPHPSSWKRLSQP